MERQPVRLLESYGLAATAFNRFEDIQALVGGTVGRNFYWRFQASNGNPVFLRDPNALAGRQRSQRTAAPCRPVRSCSRAFRSSTTRRPRATFSTPAMCSTAKGLGYRWANDDQSTGFDLIAFHYRRELADREKLTGTFYGGDIDLLNGPEGLPFIVTLPITSRKKEETGARLYAEWKGLTAIAQYTKQNVAGLHRSGYEVETGYKIPIGRGPVQYFQPTCASADCRTPSAPPPTNASPPPASGGPGPRSTTASAPASATASTSRPNRPEAQHRLAHHRAKGE
jgi:hypothetical protein